MAEGSDTYMGLGVPLYGNFQVIGRSTSLDIMTLTAAGGATGDFLVCQNSAGTEVLVIEDDGAVVIGEDARLRFAGTSPTTAPSTGLTLGDFFVYQAGNVYRLAYCVGGTNNIAYVNLNAL